MQLLNKVDRDTPTFIHFQYIARAKVVMPRLGLNPVNAKLFFSLFLFPTPTPIQSKLCFIVSRWRLSSKK